ncbi:MAG: VanZ family protein [Acidobacteriota bacterium]|nr:VanZ family protein [Acidobacteriota bacterium]
MNHLFKSIIFLIAITLPFWIAARIIIYLSRKKRNEQAQIRTEFILTTFFVYLIFVAAITVIPTQMSSFRNPNFDDLNFIPILNSIKCFLPDVTGKPEVSKLCHQNIVGNIVLFIPIGFLLPFALKGFHSLKSILVFAFCLSLSIEVIQFFSRFFGNFRVLDIDDILLNTLGACIGFGVLGLFQKRKLVGRDKSEESDHDVCDNQDGWHKQKS